VISEIACHGRRIERMAEVTAEKKAELAGFEGSYATARNEYAAARSAAKPDVEAAHSQLESVRQRLHCFVSDEDRECLHEAYDRIHAEIVDCAGEPGCCVDECRVNNEVPPDSTVSSLSGRIAHYRRQYDSAAACFTSLLAETTVVPTRAAAARTEVEAIAAALSGEAAAAEPVPDYSRLYVRALVVQHALKIGGVYAGFENVAAYTDCLCSALMCALRTWSAVVDLEGARAELVCREDSARDACQRKQDQIVDEVLTVFARICHERDHDHEHHHHHHDRDHERDQDHERERDQDRERERDQDRERERDQDHERDHDRREHPRE
jgi:hypothetical protein